MPTTLSASSVPSSEIDALRHLQQSLPEESELGRVLGKLSEGLSHGVSMTVASDDDVLTPSKAAAILGISRTHLYKILDAGVLPFHVVGERDRRISMSDVNEYNLKVLSFGRSDAESVARRAAMEDDILDAMT
ncbi:helix-turn-helix domain-containing protein [Clavibacter phaseoli]|uniref:helix-turn-helix domain-containing protein n=1 Tax=Clavibacter phaseoli TaxID=1734031 RepID=UPI000E66AA6E|nr:helix-turn-helix domain-containing protein [Clavibacter phaseoli]RIJ55710.1 DNA-binding protein [Clavibacter phaseoli]UKF32135.1 helix-turn-helix domain-containing protein [Clavibacter phaseoli]UKF38057.1 helix-turn-helix domain-containing protein [Clavibacter phaseoli]